MGLFVEYLVREPWFFFAWTLIVVFSICVHEYAHARVSLARGDPTAALTGHLTLNPLKQMGWISLVALLLFGFAWGAVPVNPDRYARRRDGALVSFSGPAANLLLCVVAALIFALAGRTIADGSGLTLRFFHLAVRANAMLFVLNLLPAPPFDGWAVLEPFVPGMERVRRDYGPTLAWVSLFALFATPLSDIIWRVGDTLAQAVLLAAVRVLGA